MINQIVDWSDKDVWEFLNYYGCKSNPLYECGYRRVGCIGCPMTGGKTQKREFAEYPKYREQYVRTFDKMLKARKTAGLTNRISWIDGEHVMRWWVGDDPMQISLFDEILE